MGIASENIKAIIAAAHPNGNLVDKAWEKYDIGIQQAKEQQFYDQITMVDPISGEPVKNIEQLNNLIMHLDKVYNLEGLLPTGSEGVSGEVERILSQEYNLKLRGKNKFTRSEQKALQTKMQELANLAFNTLQSDPTFERGIAKAAERRVWLQLLAYMGKIQITNGSFTLFISGSLEGTSIVQSIYDDMLDGIEEPIIRMKTFQENVAGSGRTTQKEGFNLFRDDSGQIIGVQFTPNFNKLSTLAFENIYSYAQAEGILESNVELNAINQLGKGTISPMDVTPEKWKQDVFNAVYQVLSQGEFQNLIPNMDVKSILDSLLIKYNVYDNIALGRSLNTLRGFTGELRGILITHLLFPNANNNLLGKAAVTLENSLKSGEAPIDIMVQLLDDAYGIQVKNISDLEEYSWGNFRDSKGMAIPNFYAERLQSSLDGAETDFFGAFAYNKPVGSPSDYNPYREIYGGFEAAFNDKFAPVYSQLALYIIRQITKIKNSNNSLLSGTIKNDFFFMNNKVVPASAFLQSITNMDSAIQSSFTLSSPTEGHYSSSAEQPSSYSGYTKETFIHYEIKVNFSTLLQSAYNGI